MRRSSSGCLLFFIVFQAAIFFFLKRYQSFVESKWTFVGAESVLVVITIWWYLMLKPQERRRRPQPSPVASAVTPLAASKPDEKERLTQAFAEEKGLLEEKVKRLEEGDLFAKQRVQDLEQEKATLKNKLSEAEGRLVEVQKTTNSCCQAIQELTFEVDRLLSQLEQERRQHSIEVRALLRKEGDEELGGKKKSSKAAPAVPKVATPPLPSILLLLSTCQKGLDLHLAHDWPANEHRLLVRRKFFDTVQKMNSTPFAVISLDSPSDHFLSSKLPPNLSINEVRAAVMSYKSTFSQLQRFEPYHFTDERLGGRWVAFRTAWENLDDLIALAPS